VNVPTTVKTDYARLWLGSWRVVTETETVSKLITQGRHRERAEDVVLLTHAE